MFKDIWIKICIEPPKNPHMIKIDIAKLNHYDCPWSVLSDTVSLNVSENIAISSDMAKCQHMQNNLSCCLIIMNFMKYNLWFRGNLFFTAAYIRSYCPLRQGMCRSSIYMYHAKFNENNTCICGSLSIVSALVISFHAN